MNQISDHSFYNQTLHRFTGFFSLTLLGLFLGFIVVWMKNPLFALAALAGIGIATLVVVNVELGFVLLAFITHANLSTALIEQVGAPSLAKILVSLIIISLVIRYSIHGIRFSGHWPITLLITIYGLTGLFSILYEPFTDNSLTVLLAFFKDSVIAIISVLLIKKYSLLRQIFWAFIASGSLLGSVALFQYVTGTYDQTYWGLSLAPQHHIVGDVDGFRLSGSLGDPNFFAMFQFVVLPLAVDRILSEKFIMLKILAIYCTSVILFSVIFSYSRGGFLGIAVMVFTFACLYRHRAWQVIAGSAILLCILLSLPNSHYIERIFTLEYLAQDKTGQLRSEQSFQGRKSEMYVAAMIFRDNPLTGVGVGNYEKYYQKYAQKLLIDLRKEEREAHCRYLEILAETGIIGFTAFCAILWVMYRGLLAAWRRARLSGLKEMEYSVAALGISLVGLFTGFVFLHDAWPRFPWMLIGLAFAVPNLFPKEENMGERST